MKVYTLVGIEDIDEDFGNHHDEETLIGVFSSREEAEEKEKSLGWLKYYDYEIKEWDV